MYFNTIFHDSTLKYDSPKETLREREIKLSLYAEANINHYWIINLVDNYLEIYNNPFSDNKNSFYYRNKSILLPDDSIEIPNFDDICFDLKTLFPVN